LKMNTERDPPSRLPVPLQVVGRALRDWWDDWVNMAVLNLLLALAWLTIILGPPATFGLYYVTNRLAHGQSLGPQGLIEGGRRYFIASWRWMLLNLAVAVLLGVSYVFYASLPAAWANFIQAAFILLAASWLIVQFYALPYLMEQEEQRVGLALRNAVFTALAAPGYTLVVVGVAALIAALSIGTVAFLFLGGPCLLAALGNRAVIERLETYQVRKREQEATRNQE
jgi:uncharacterized membrane protein YesL